MNHFARLMKEQAAQVLSVGAVLLDRLVLTCLRVWRSRGPT